MCIEHLIDMKVWMSHVISGKEWSIAQKLGQRFEPAIQSRNVVILHAGLEYKNVLRRGDICVANFKPLQNVDN